MRFVFCRSAREEIPLAKCSELPLLFIVEISSELLGEANFRGASAVNGIKNMRP